MKLRLRSFETKETLKLEVPNPCNLHHLRELVSLKLPSPPHSTIHFSLNQKDRLTTSSPEESIQSVGITSGDLIYFTTNPNGFSATSQPKPQQSQNPQSLKTPDSEKANPEETSEAMEIDDNQNSISEVRKSFSVPGFLRKVFTDELGDNDGPNHKLLGIAVRAVLLESGFVELDNNVDLQASWHTTSFHYTLPNILNDVTKTVKIKFQNLGKFCKVYGSLVNGTGTTVHSVVLDEDRLVPFLNVVWANCGPVVETAVENGLLSTVLPEQEVFEFWRKVKDGLALPLLIDLCEKAGFELPPCFTRLPTELKLNILELVSGVDLANVSCVCSELRYLASSEDLWRKKYDEVFGSAEGSAGGGSFKERFVKAWEGRKRRRVAGRSGFNLMRRGVYGPFAPRRFPPIIGGDYDVLPGFGGPGGGGLRLWNVMPNCNLGGFRS